MKYIGIDGCKIGWFFVILDDKQNWEIGVVKEIGALLPRIIASEMTLIDIPLGLREDIKTERLCDLSARKVLGARRSSVFPTPSRAAIYCSSYEEASQINYINTGRRLSQQSWAITGKIKEVDIFVRDNLQLKHFREIHPEVCFWGLNSKQEMNFSKKKQEGFEERRIILEKHFKPTMDIIGESLSRYYRKEVAKDDILDALVGAITAKEVHQLYSLPASPELDAKGIKMEMVYSSFE